MSDLEIDPNDDNVWYLTVGSGGLWKTVNRGNTWKPIFDDYPSYSLGAVVVDPRNSNVVYVATAGPLWNSGGDRGLYKTTDAGRTWTRVLFVTVDTGITDAVFHPLNPDIIYAAGYQRRRQNAMTIGGGPEATIYKTTDAGTTWNRIENGIPAGDKGRIALGVDPRNPDRVYAIVVARGDNGGFFMSENAGTSWQRMSNYSGGDPQYYGEIFVDPHRPDTIWNVADRPYKGALP